MVIYLANLQSISKDLYEAADIDGANGLQRFFYITLPLMCPSVKIIVVPGLIGGMKVFDIIYMLTQGGPNNSTMTISYYTYYQTFGLFDFGYGATLGMIVTMITVFIALIYKKILKADDVY